MTASHAEALSHSRVLKIAVPIVLANATIPILGAVDTGVVGQLDDAVPIGAVGIGAIVISTVCWIFGFFRMGTTGLTSQAFGAGDQPEVRALLARVVIAGLVGGFALIILQSPLFWASFQLSPASNEVETLARQYMSIRIYSAPAAIALYGITGWLIALERTKSVLLLQIWMNGLNVSLDLLFVLGFDWGVPGVAWATFLAEWTALALGLWLCRTGFAQGSWKRWALIFDLSRLKRMMSVNGDILIRSLFLQASFLSFLFLGSSFGDETLAANQVLLQFLYITAYGLDGFAFAAETLVGQAMGARARTTLRRAAVLTSFWGCLIVAVLSLIFALTGSWVIDVMTKSEAVRSVSREYLVWMILAPIFGWASWMLDGIFIGATRTRDMRIAMIWSTLVYALAVWVLLPIYENHGLWMALLILFAARGVTLGLRYPSLEAAVEAPTK